MRTFDAYLEKKLRDQGFQAEYEALEPEFEIIRAIIETRKISGLTQKQLAEKTGIAQGDISKIERGVANPSLRTLKTLASGMNMKLRLEFIPRTVKSVELRVEH
jgi:transcriptional regulator with XRE-family HTH domain